jgi:hypothetical protein
MIGSLEKRCQRRDENRMPPHKKEKPQPEPSGGTEEILA